MRSLHAGACLVDILPSARCADRDRSDRATRARRSCRLNRALRFMSALQELHPDMSVSLHPLGLSLGFGIQAAPQGPALGRVVETIDGGCEPSSS